MNIEEEESIPPFYYYLLLDVIFCEIEYSN